MEALYIIELKMVSRSLRKSLSQAIVSKGNEIPETRHSVPCASNERTHPQRALLEDGRHFVY